MTANIPHPAWPNFINPHRFVEARVSLKRDPEGLLSARGAHQETALHWAAMGDSGLVMDMVAVGLEPNALDRMGRTPLDWVNDRLWMGVAHAKSPLTAEAKDQLRFKTERVVPGLWGQGFRPGAGTHPGQAWALAGAFPLICLLDEPGTDGLRHWGVDYATALHAWAIGVQAPNRPAALDDLLARGLLIDELDANGRTPLRYAVEAWARTQIHHRTGAETVALLLAKGANPEIADQQGVVPGQAPLLVENIDPKMCEGIEKALARARAFDR
jgi:hypothetical protein